ncbi:MAG: Fic family protein [Gordonibacter sp.]|uniref:Fic family protein n=1 Tax=Gordonibacter sp. TaxID=1968902 RepID=UPI002FC58F06
MDILRTAPYTGAMYLHERKDWTNFTWDDSALAPLVAKVCFAQGLLLGKMSDIGFDLEAAAEADVLSSEVLASSRIEGVALDAAKVRSSVSRQLGIEESEPASDTREADGAVALIFEAVKNCNEPLSHERLRGWHNVLFPTAYSGLRKIKVAQYRDQSMQVVSGAIGKERVHFEALAPGSVESAMDDFIAWFNREESFDAVIKAGIAHLWFLTVHPFDDGNGRIARTLTEMLLARSDRSSRRFYSMAEYIYAHRASYYQELERAQKGDSDVTAWLTWFLVALDASLERSLEDVRAVLERSRFWKQLESVSLNQRQRLVLERLKGNFEGKLTASKWAKMCKVSPDTALRDINDLIGKGILGRAEGGGRSVSYVLRNAERSS